MRINPTTRTCSCGGSTRENRYQWHGVGNLRRKEGALQVARCNPTATHNSAPLHTGPRFILAPPMNETLLIRKNARVIPVHAVHKIFLPVPEGRQTQPRHAPRHAGEKQNFDFSWAQGPRALLFMFSVAPGIAVFFLAITVFVLGEVPE